MNVENIEAIYMIFCTSMNFIQTTWLKYHVYIMLFDIVNVPISLICLYLYPNILTTIIFSYSIIIVPVDALSISIILLSKKWIWSKENGYNYNIVGYVRFIWHLLTDKILLLFFTLLLFLFSKQFL